MPDSSQFVLPPAPSPYFLAHEYSVTLPAGVTLETAFDKLLSSDAIKPVAMLSTWATHFETNKQDAISLPFESLLQDEQELYSKPPASPQGGEPDHASAKSVERVFFEMTEVAPYLFGLYKAHLHIKGCQTIDRARNTILYESHASPNGVWVWKLRSLHAGESGEVRVTETLKLTAGSKILKNIIGSPARKAHKQHMDSYHTLFE